MPTTKAQQKAVAKYRSKTYDQLKIEVKKGKKESLQAHAAERGESLNGFVNRAIDETVIRDKAATDTNAGAE
jgi:predicted HicB family RNase H-like nuclease